MEKQNLQVAHNQYLQSLDTCGAKEAQVQELDEQIHTKQLEHDALHKQHLEQQRQLSAIHAKYDKSIAAHQKIRQEMASIERELSAATIDDMELEEEEPVAIPQEPKRFKPQSTIKHPAVSALNKPNASPLPRSVRTSAVATNPEDATSSVPAVRKDTALFQHFRSKTQYSNSKKK